MPPYGAALAAFAGGLALTQVPLRRQTLVARDASNNVLFHSERTETLASLVHEPSLAAEHANGILRAFSGAHLEWNDAARTQDSERQREIFASLNAVQFTRTICTFPFVPSSARTRTHMVEHKHFYSLARQSMSDEERIQALANAASPARRCAPRI